LSVVYILTNESMPGCVKIGMTSGTVLDRILSLDNTSVPLPFQCYYAARVEDKAKVEKALHTAFGDFRIRTSREFFRIDPYRVKAILEVLALEDVTPRNDDAYLPEDKVALENATKYVRRFSFASAGIPTGATLEFSKSALITCQVVSDSSVSFRNSEMSVSKAALQALHELGYEWTTVAGTEYWLYQGETILSLRTAKESQADE